MKWLPISWIVLTLAVLGGSTASTWHGGLATGFHSCNFYGWPDGWLAADVYDTTQWIDGEKVPGKRTVNWRMSDGGSLTLATLSSAGIAGCIVLPFALAALILRRRQKRRELARKSLLQEQSGQPVGVDNVATRRV